jgi:hypothetical protein
MHRPAWPVLQVSECNAIAIGRFDAGCKRLLTRWEQANHNQQRLSNSDRLNAESAEFVAGS